MRNIPWLPLILASFFLFTSGYYLGQQKSSKDDLSPQLIAGSEIQQIRVHVVGAIKDEGLHWLERNACVDDAIKAAGGLHNTADMSQINLARPLRHGERIVIPFQVRAEELEVSPLSQNPATKQASPVTQDSRVNINTASVEELTQLPGIGPAKASAIIEFREKNGFFISVDEIVNVPGIGPKTLENLRSHIRVN